MRSKTHVMSAAVMAPVMYYLAQKGAIANLFSASAIPPVDASAFALSFVLGAKLPDTLEMPEWKNGERTSVIPHRTITHAWWVWVLLIYLSVQYIEHPVLLSIALGLCFSALWHIFLDFLTPMGVPVILGNRFRVSFSLPVRNKDNEVFVAVFLPLFASVPALNHYLAFW